MKMPLSSPEYRNYELWLALKAPSPAEALQFERSPLDSRHNLEFDAFTAAWWRDRRPLLSAPKWVPETRWQEWWLCPLLVSARHDSAGYRGMGRRKAVKCFWRSADGTFEAAICSIIEPNSAKLNCALSRFQIPVQLAVQSWNKVRGWAGFGTSRAGQSALIICGTQFLSKQRAHVLFCCLAVLASLSRACLGSFVNWHFGQTKPWLAFAVGLPASVKKKKKNKKNIWIRFQADMMDFSVSADDVSQSTAPDPDGQDCNRTPLMALGHWPRDTLYTLQHIYYPSEVQHTHTQSTHM